MGQPRKRETEIVAPRLELSSRRPTAAADVQISKLLDAISDMAALLAERIFHDADAEYTSTNFRDSAEISRLADVADQLRMYDRSVPSIIGHVLDIASVHGWRSRLSTTC